MELLVKLNHRNFLIVGHMQILHTQSFRDLSLYIYGQSDNSDYK